MDLYECMTDSEKFKEQLPSKENKHVLNVWNKFEM